MNRSLQALVFALLWLALLPPTNAHSQTNTHAPTRIYVGMYLHDISDLSLNEGTYDVDLDLWAKWRGDFDPNEIRFANAAKLEREVLEIASDDDWHAARWRIRGTLRGDFPVQDFPFDTQKLTIQLELPRHLGDLTPDLAGSGIASQFSITDWRWSQDFRPVVSSATYPSDLGRITDEGRPAEVRKVSFEVSLVRPLSPVALKLFLPLGIVALIVFLSLFVPPTNLQPPLTMCVTGLVAVFAFQFSVTDVMPSVAYLTLADVLFITVYVLAVCCVMVVVSSHILYLKERGHIADRLRLGARIILPVGVGLAVFFAVPSPSKAEGVEVAEAPKTERPQSVRQTLRIGTTSPLRLASSPIGAASLWGLAYRDDHGRNQALVVERMPRMDNDGLRFLTDGSLEVAWTLRNDAKWSDGSPVRAQDLLLPLQKQPDPRIINIEQPDERTVILRWDRRVVDALRPPALWPSAHLERTVDLDDAEALQHALAYKAQPTVGPYRIVEVGDEHMIAERNPHFLLSPAPIERVELHHFSDSAALREALLDDRIDLSTPNGISADDLRAFTEHAHLEIREAPNMSAVFIAPPITQSPWNTHDARRALLQAIDRRALAQRPYGEDQTVAHVPTTATPPTGIVTQDYNPQAARSYFESLDDPLPELTLYWSVPLHKHVAERIALNLQEIGLRVRLEQVESTWPLWLSQDFDGLLLHSLRVEAQSNHAQWWNLPNSRGQYQRDVRHDAWTDAIHALVDQFEHALFWERREQLRERIDAAWAEALPLIPLYFAQQHVIVAKDLKGWDRPSDQLFGQTLEYWYFEAPTP